MTDVSRRAPSLSIARRINGERLALTGWSRAILLQMAHPLIAAGVAEHSAFRGGARVAAARLHSTVRAMLGLTFGDVAGRQRVVEHIRAIHRRVRGETRQPTGVFPSGTKYSAEDPALLLWVHATLIDSTLLAYRTVVADLTDEDMDDYCAEAATVAIDLGAHAAAVPLTRAALSSYMASMYASGTLAVGVDARAVVDAVLSGPLPSMLPPAGWLNRLVTTGWLPPSIRDQYGLAWSPSRDRQLARTERWLKASRHVLPDVAARWPEARSANG